MKKRVLVAEDSPTLRRIVANCLKKAGFEVEQASDEVEALRIIRSTRTPFDAILADLEMRKEKDIITNGISLAQCVRRMDGYQFTPIIIMDTVCDEQTKASAQQVGVTDLVVKDYSFATALRALQAALAK